jgi:hypothetical protein
MTGSANAPLVIATTITLARTDIFILIEPDGVRWAFAHSGPAARATTSQSYVVTPNVTQHHVMITKLIMVDNAGRRDSIRRCRCQLEALVILDMRLLARQPAQRQPQREVCPQTTRTATYRAATTYALFPMEEQALQAE